MKITRTPNLADGKTYGLSEGEFTNLPSPRAGALQTFSASTTSTRSRAYPFPLSMAVRAIAPSKKGNRNGRTDIPQTEARNACSKLNAAKTFPRTITGKQASITR